MFKENEPNRIAVRFFSRRILQCGVVRIYFFRIIATLFRARRAVGASLRGQTVVGGRARAKRPREAHSARTSLWISSCRYKIPRQVDSIAHSIIYMSLRRQTRGSQRGLERLGPTRNAAQSACLFAAPGHNNISVALGICSNRCTHNKSVRIGRLFRFANSTAAEKAIGSKSEAQSLNRVGSSPRHFHGSHSSESRPKRFHQIRSRL